MKTIKKLLVAFIALAFIGITKSGYGQVTWTLSQSVNNVDCYYSITQCNGEEVVFLKFVNNNSGNVTVSWKEIFNTQFGNGVEGSRGQLQLTLAPGVTEQQSCSDNTNPSCLINSFQVDVSYVAKISGFEFTNVTVQ